MPDWAQPLADVLPFKWTFGFPIEALIGQLSNADLLAGLATQALWIGIGAIALRSVAQGSQALFGGGWMRSLGLIWTFLRVDALNELQYRANLAVQVFQSGISLFTGLAVLGLVFGQTDNLNGWTQSELSA